MQLPPGLSLDLAGGIIVLGALALAIIIVVAAFVKARYPGAAKPYNLRDSMGSAQWDFTKSWASTLTVVGALLGTILSAIKNAPAQYILLHLFFVFLAVVAPLLSNFIGKIEPVGTSQLQKDISKIAELVSTIAHPNQPGQPAPANQDEPSTFLFQSYVAGFLVTCTLTLWAVIGEMVTLTFLIGVLSKLMPGDIFLIIVQALFLLVALFAGYYGWKTIPMTLQAQVSHRRAAREQQINSLIRIHAMTLDDATNIVDQGPKPAQPSWPLL